MRRTIRVQPATRSHLNISKLCSMDHEVIREPTTPLIHSEARIWLIHSGRGALNLQGETYELGPGDVVCILPWQITDVTRVEEPLQYTLLIYDLDSVNRLMKAFYESDLLERGWLHSLSALPVLHCGGAAGKPVEEIFARLQEELGLESTLDAPEPAPYGNLLVMSSLVELCIRLERIRRRQGKPPQDPAEPAGDKSRILRYMYVHLSEKLTLDMLSRLFYCSPSSISAYLTKATGLSFFDLLNEMRIGKTADYLVGGNIGVCGRLPYFQGVFRPGRDADRRLPQNLSKGGGDLPSGAGPPGLHHHTGHISRLCRPPARPRDGGCVWHQRKPAQ